MIGEATWAKECVPEIKVARMVSERRKNFIPSKSFVIPEHTPASLVHLSPLFVYISLGSSWRNHMTRNVKNLKIVSGLKSHVLASVTQNVFILKNNTI